MIEGDRFDGCIAGLGTGAGLRVVVGHWPRSPFGPFTDVMVEQRDGHRVLLAPTREVADLVAETYQFDEVRVVVVDVEAAGCGGGLDVAAGARRGGTRAGAGWGQWRITAGPLVLGFDVGGRPLLLLLAVGAPVLGWLLGTIGDRLEARNRPMPEDPVWCIVGGHVCRFSR